MLKKNEFLEYHLVDEKEWIKTPQLEELSLEKIKKVRGFHESFDEYSVTPLHRLKGLANYYAVGEIFVKDESYRFGLNAFKVLGSAYAIGRFLCERLEMDIDEVSFEYLRREDIKEKLGEITFVTATDGNHGRGLAWAAHQLGQSCVVYMPRGSSQIRLEAIKKKEPGQALSMEIMMTPSDSPMKWRKNTAGSSYKTQPGRVMKPYPAGLCRAMEVLSMRPWSNWRRFLVKG